MFTLLLLDYLAYNPTIYNSFTVELSNKNIQMYRLIIAIFFIAFVSTTSFAQPDTIINPPIFKDQTITYPDDPPPFKPPTSSMYFLQTEDFKVTIKCPTKVNIDTLDYIDQKTYTCQNGAVTLTIIRTVYNNGMYHSDSKTLEYDLDYTQRKFVEQHQVRVLGTVPRMIKGYPGKEFRYEYWLEDKMTFRRVYIVKNVLYELFYEGPKAKKFQNEIDDFFDSFTLSKIEENPTPYFVMPTQKEIDNPPYTANFHGETITKIDVVNSLNGKAAIIAEINEHRDKDKSGIISLLVWYSIMPGEVSEADKVTIINNQQKSIFNIYPDAELLKDDYDAQGRKNYKVQYKIGGTEPVIEERISFFHNNTLYLISALYRATQPKDNRIDTFLSSFEIIE